MKTVHILLPSLLHVPETESLLLVEVGLVQHWIFGRISLVGGGVSKEHFEGLDYGMFVIDGDVWTEDEVEVFAASRNLVHRVLDLEDDELLSRIRRTAFRLALNGRRDDHVARIDDCRISRS